MIRFLGFVLIAAAAQGSAALAQNAGRVPETLQDRVAPISATIDASGRIIPASPFGEITKMERIGEAPNGVDPCPGARALSADAAKQLVLRVATEEGFYPDFVSAVSKVESAYLSTTVSPKGAYGLMQLMPDTATEMQVNICDPQDNIRGGIRKLRVLHSKYRNPFYMLAAYNAGEQALLNNNGLPPYPETLNFVARVMNEFYDWPKLGAAADGPSADSGVSTSSRVAASAAAPKRDPAGWQSGFVMNFDYSAGVEK